MSQAQTSTEKPHLGQFILSSGMKTICYIFIVLGVATFVAGLAMHNDRVWTAYLVSFFFFVSLALGGLFFTALQHLTSAGWSVGIRRLPEAFTSFLPVTAVGAVLLFLGGSKLFVWLDPHAVAEDTILQAKTGYLNVTFWAIRLFVFFALWLFFKKNIIGNSLRQDVSGDENLTRRSLPFSIAFILIFAISYSLFSVDSLMSLQPHWFSTIFGIYCFAGLFQSTLALIAMTMIVMMHKGLVRGYITDHHLHDMGKFVFAFTIFYAYIAFSQFLLIWYANLPEETEFYWNRMYGGWLWISIGIAVFKFIVPFFALLPRWAKRKHCHLFMVCALILVMQYVDVYWIVYPNFNDNHLVFSLWEVLIFLGFAGGFGLVVMTFLSKHSLVPIKDPRLHESMQHEVIY
jgi:hypothetical protein